MKEIIFILILVLGSIMNLLCYKPIREYKDYSRPYMTLIVGIILAICMSIALPLSLYFNDDLKYDYGLPDFIKKHRPFHDCRKYSTITFEETYEDEKGNITTEYNPNYKHHTHRVWTCKYCGKVQKDKLQ